MNTNIDQFLNSLEKLRPLKVNVFCADHYGYITGDEAQTIVSETIKEALGWKARLHETLRRNTLDIDSAAREITSSLLRERKTPSPAVRFLLPATFCKVK